MNTFQQPPYETPVYPPQQTDWDLFSGKNSVIMVLVVLLALSFVGINVLDSLSNLLKGLEALVSPIVKPLLGVFGYTTGTIINKTADVIADTATAGVEVAEGTVHEIGDLLISASNNGVDTAKLDSALNISRNKTVNQPEADTTSNPIQSPITANKGGWCLVGEVADRRGCISVDDANKCMSGQVFPAKDLCMNPTRTPN